MIGRPRCLQNLPGPPDRNAPLTTNLRHQLTFATRLQSFRRITSCSISRPNDESGVIEAVGAEVRTLKVGDRVLAPFTFSDGSCEFCEEGLTTSCAHGGFWGGARMDGGQGEAVRAPFADATLVALPPGTDAMASKLLPLTDVLPTGHHAAVSAHVGPGSTVVIIGDGAVGLCAVIAARRLGAEHIFLLGHQGERLELGKRFGATNLISARGDEAVTHVLEATKGGARSVIECVGAATSLSQAVQMARPGGQIGYVGVPHHAEGFDFQPMFLKNLGLKGGVAPVRPYIPALLADVLAGNIDPSPLLDMTVSLDRVPEGYAAMDERRATKVLIKIA